ncbi:hypothetical protein GO755_34710 [Spirosoma sp. HMF4905]|uniref:Uncharacterized protein n=2 Tax=Spirosoma arboris TaxID=2682092 RepID=A0A7K1SNQ9_9BACT|nr:hypothetical protein [Spirosoma arboris]
MGLSNSVKTYVALAITTLFPLKNWYIVAYAVSGVMSYLYKPQKNKYTNTWAINHAYRLNGLLAVMTRKGRSFPMPVHGRGEELFFKQRPNGLVLCSTHIPLSKVALRYLMECGFKPTVAIVGDPSVQDSIAVWGSLEKIPAIHTGSFVLQKAKRILQQGGSVVALVDHHLGDPYSPNIFRLAEKLNSDIVFFDAALQKDGTVDVRFRESEWNGSSCANRVHQQMNELYQHTANLLQHYGNSSYFKPPVEVSELSLVN